jgi:hypothetical protein
LGGEIIEPFRAWAPAQPQYAGLQLSNIVVVTLPQPMIVAMLLKGGIALGNLAIEVSRASGFYPDIIMGGASSLTQLHNASIVGDQAHCSLAIAGYHCWSRPAIRTRFGVSRIWRGPISAS